MKFAAVLIAAVVTFAASVNAVECGPEETLKLLALASDPTIDQCEIDSKFNFLPPSHVPTQEDFERMCASSACTSTLTALGALNPADCDNTFSNGITLNVKSILTQFASTCGRRNLRN